MNRNIVPTIKISHNEYKDLLLNKNVWDIRWIGFKVKIIKQEFKKWTLRNLWTLMKFKKFLLSCFADRIYIENNGCDGLALGYQS